MRILYLFVFTYVISANFSYMDAQITGLSGWNIFVDPGHSQDENMGIYNYSEAKKVLQVGLNLRDLLLNKTDIDTVYMSRTNEQQLVSLTQRTDRANTIGAAWYHSIHSDAGSPSSNSTLLLYGGWRKDGQTVEKIPNGGKEMSSHIIDLLTRGMRIPTRGSYADRTFYQGFPDNHENQYPYLHVNRETFMPSELSEGGFHTSPVQNQLNMNAKWKRLEAYTLFWSILDLFEIERPFVGIAAGIISDIESGLPINGAVINVNGQTDTTDTYESLFHLYSNNPDQLRNGFYFFEDLPAGTVSVTIAADGYDPYSGTISIEDTFFTFKDISLISNVPPIVSAISPEPNDSIYPGDENIGIIFSRPMNKVSVESTLVISPPVEVNFIWSDGDKRLTITANNFNFSSDYQLTISGNSLDKYGHYFDGDKDGTGGDNFVLSFKTKAPDFLPPVIVDNYPVINQPEVELQPIISISFDEEINNSSISGKVRVIRNSDQSFVSGIFKHYIINDRSVINLFPSSNLVVDEDYTVIIDGGYEDNLGNKAEDQFTFSFTVGDQEISFVNNIENFENGIDNWWVPQQSGSTTGIITEETNVYQSIQYYNYIAGGSGSMKLEYEWDSTALNWLLREYYSPVTPGFNSSNILQTYLFGDGSGNKFRFAVRDNTGTVEVSPWYNINWIGWKLLSWDMLNDGTGSWVGNGVLEDPLRFDSYQLTYLPGSRTKGEIYFDDLRVINKTTVGVDDELLSGIPSDYVLENNYPNPFNPSTQLRFSIPEAGFVKLEVYNLLGQKISTLINKEMSSGYYSVNFNADDISSGIYVYTLSVNDFFTSKKMVLLK